MANSDNGSPLEFGLVCKERHKDAPREEDRSEHNHAATFACAQLYWRKIRDISDKKYHIKLNCVAHDAYVTMFKYLRCASAKKPVHELDVTPYFSPAHPQGDALKELLEVGARYLQVRSQRVRQPIAPKDAVVRSQFGVFFNWVVDHDLHGQKGVAQLQVDARAELKDGRCKLIDFIKKHRTSLEDQLDFCWEMVGAEARLARLGKSRLQILLEAAMDSAATCANGDNHCSGVYDRILENQQVASIEFRHMVFETLRHGRRKGNALMIVGGKDTGKTTVTEPAGHIYKTMVTPQSDSFCPLQDIRGHELFLWQDFRYNPGHPRDKEQGLRLDEGTWNRLLEGLPTLIGVAKTDGSRGDFVYMEDTAFILTGPFKMQAYKDGCHDAVETEQLDCRVKYVFFNRPAIQRPNRGFKACPKCWSRWILLGELQWVSCHGQPCDTFMQQVQDSLSPNGAGHDILGPMQNLAAQTPDGLASASPAQSSFTHRPDHLHNAQDQYFAQLSQLMSWRVQGLLSDTEFANAKKRLGL